MRVNEVLMILGDTQYGALKIFTESLAEGFREIGVNVDIMDIQEGRMTPTELFWKEYDLILSFNGMWDSSAARARRRNLNTMTWSFLVDHPLYQHTRLLQSHRNQIISCVERKHVAYVQKYYSSNPYVCHMPHGGVLTDSEKKFEARRYDVSFFGNYSRPEGWMKPLNNYDDNMKILIGRIIEGLWYETDRSLEEELLLQLNNIGLIVSDDEFRNTVRALSFVDKYIRSKRQHDVVEALLCQGIKVDVFGSGWENFESDYKDNLNIHGSVSYEDSLAEMSESKIVLNTMPLYTEDSHEKIFTIMGQKSICFTYKSEYLAEEFSDKEDLFFYSVSELDKLPEMVKQVLNKEYDADKIIEKAYHLVDEKHLWKNRAKEILEYLKPIEIAAEPVVMVENSVDDAFCQLMQYVKQTEESLLYNRIKESYLFYSEMAPNYTQSLKRSFVTYPYWGSWNPEEGDFGVIKERTGEFKKHADKFVWLYQRLADVKSKSILTNILLNWETFDINYLMKCCGENIYRHYFDKDIVELSADEVFVDLGAYIGDTLDDFLRESLNRYKKIYCYEFSRQNADKLEERARGQRDVVVRKCAVGGEHGWVANANEGNDSSADRVIVSDSGEIEVVTLDDDITEKITFIKSDIEGAELDALKGAENHIKRDHPKLAFSIYHGNQDIWRIADYVNSLDDTYKFYIRYYGGNLYPNEFVLYAI